MPSFTFERDYFIRQHKLDAENRPMYDAQGKQITERVKRTEGLGTYTGATRNEAILLYLRTAGWTTDDVGIKLRVAPQRQADFDALKVRPA